MKRALIAIVLATVFTGVPVFADSRDVSESALGAIATFANPPAPAAPQFRRRHRRRRNVIVRRRRRHQRHMYVIRRRVRRL